MAEANLEGRVALVTGGGSGIGRASARELAAQGAKVCVADIAGENADSVAKEICEDGGSAISIQADVTDEAANAAMVKTAVDRFGALHIAHLNAGILAAGTILDGSLEDFDRVLAVNLRGVFLGMRATAPEMIRAGGGSIVVTASVAGLRGGGGMPSYYASKHGVLGLVKSAASEFAPHGIRVNAVCPGFVDTPILGPFHGVKEVTEGILGKMAPLGRIAQPEDVATVVAFLASDGAAYVTGSAYPVDGGLTAVIASSSGSGDEIAAVGEELAEQVESHS